MSPNAQRHGHIATTTSLTQNSGLSHSTCAIRPSRNCEPQDGLSWHQPLESIYGVVEPGFWALTRRADLVYASQHPELFTSAQGVSLNPLPIEIQRISTFFLTMDPPEHTVYRRLISSAFTPKQLRRIEEQIHANAVQIVDDLVGAGDIDFVTACSTRLPMLTIAEMLGVAADKREAVAQAGEALFSSSDEDYTSREERAEFAMRAMMLLVDTAVDLAKFRRRAAGRGPDDQHRQRRGRRDSAH